MRGCFWKHFPWNRLSRAVDPAHKQQNISPVSFTALNFCSLWWSEDTLSIKNVSTILLAKVKIKFPDPKMHKCQFIKVFHVLNYVNHWVIGGTRWSRRSLPIWFILLYSIPDTIAFLLWQILKPQIISWLDFPGSQTCVFLQLMPLQVLQSMSCLPFSSVNTKWYKTKQSGWWYRNKISD